MSGIIDENIHGINSIDLETSMKELDYKYDTFKPKILIFGVGGGGTNAVNSIANTDIRDVDFVVANTDFQSLNGSKVNKRILLGSKSRRGLGAGSNPVDGKNAAEESIDEIEKVLEGADIVFLTAGMGGGTGTGAIPVIAKKAKELGILVAAIVTKPLLNEGEFKMNIAKEGIKELKKYTDTLIIIPNQNLLRIVNQNTTMIESMKMVDNVLINGIKGITDLITKPGFMNLDFSDVRTAMSKSGRAIMGMGEGTGPNRSEKAVEEALSNPLLDNMSISGAKAIIINVTGSSKTTFLEYNDTLNRIKKKVNNKYAIIKAGHVLDDSIGDTLRVSIFITGIEEQEDFDLIDSNIEENKDIENSDYIYSKNEDDEEDNDDYIYSKNEDDEDDFFDMGEVAVYDDFSNKIQPSIKNTQQYDTNTLEYNNQEKQDKLKSKNNKVVKNDEQRTNKKTNNFFSNLFGSKKSNTKNEELIDVDVNDDEDIEINVEYYNTPSYLRKKE